MLTYPHTYAHTQYPYIMTKRSQYRRRRTTSSAPIMRPSNVRSLVTKDRTCSVFPDLQSAYRAHHSTETAVLKVVGDILLALDSGNLALLSLLYLSAAFDTVDHDTLFRRLQTSYGLDGVVIKWFASCLSARTQHVRTPTTTSLPSSRVWRP